MDFYFTGDEAKLTRTVMAGGLGLKTSDLSGVTRWQRDMGYCFNWHTGTHGDPCVYARVGTYTGYNLPCIWLAGTNALGTRGGMPPEASEVVSANLTLFLAMYGNFYGTGGSTTATASTSTLRQEYACKSCKKKYGKHTDIVAAGVAIGSYPPRCPKCGGVVSPG